MSKPTLRLEDDVAAWLHHVADELYDGDVEKAMNGALRVVMAANQAPGDPWAGINEQYRQQQAARRRSRE